MSKLTRGLVAGLSAIWAVALTASIGIASAASPKEGRSSWMVRLPGEVLPALAKATRIAPTKGESNQQMTLTIVLKRDDQAGFDRYLREIYDRRSTNFHKFLAQQKIADRFGPSRASYNSVLNYIRRQGLAPARTSANRLTLSVKGRRADVERAFHVSIRDYRLGSRTFYANEDAPAVTSDLARQIAAVEGLSNMAKLERSRSALLKDIAGQKDCYNTYNAPGIANTGLLQLANKCKQAWKNDVTLYNWRCTTFFLFDWFGFCKTLPSGPPEDEPTIGLRAQLLTKGGIASPSDSSPTSGDGEGQTIGLVEFDSFHPQDVSDFLNLGTVAVPNQISQLATIQVDGGAPIGANEEEVLLDIDAVITIATGANYRVYSAPFSGVSSFADIFNQMLSDRVTIISNSWSACEDEVSQADAQAIDTIFENAAAAGVSVVNGAGDTGSTCLDGSLNTIGVPADSPHATAVGGSTANAGPAGVYLGESWWNGVNEVPPTGQGGFGTSKYFTAPMYQAGISGTAMRSIPDVVLSADPTTIPLTICEADNGGCPTNLAYGGTSASAPIFAAALALLNESHGTNLGAVNPLIYPLANTNAFHSPASMSSDFAHVGLGSPNLGILAEDLDNVSSGLPDPTNSLINLPGSSFAADGSTVAYVVVQLRDSNGLTVSGKSVSLAANSGTNATISPAMVTTDLNGAATFMLTDATVETLSLTATDITDSILIPATTSLAAVAPSASGGSLSAQPSTVADDGMSQTTILVTLKDSLGRPSPNKLVNISQTGNSVIAGPNPPVTDSNGKIQFNATDINAETITYSAVDITDGNLPIPGAPQMTFSGNAGNPCAVPNPPAAPGLIVTPYVTGFVATSLTAPDGFPFGCMGVSGIAFDSMGNLYANDAPTGNIYKFPPGGGVATAPLNGSSLGKTLTGLAFDKNGNLFASFDVTGNSSTIGGGAVVQIDPSNGSITRTISPGLTCPTVISIDPLSGDLFTDDTCTGLGTDNSSIWRISGPAGMSPSRSVYTTTTNTPNSTLAFAPGGTIYMWTDAKVAKVPGTNVMGPPTASILPGLNAGYTGMIAGGQGSGGDGTFLIENPFAVSTGAPLGISLVDLTTNPGSQANSFTTASGANTLVTGPDGCIYAAEGTTIFRISDYSGGCSYSSTLGAPTLVLAPNTVTPNPAQGTSQSFTATLHYASVPDGTSELLGVTGANQRVYEADTKGGVATFSYSGVFPGVDTLTAEVNVNGSGVVSNQSVVTWVAGRYTTFLGINQNPQSGDSGQVVNLSASLVDVSTNPVTLLNNQTVNFSVGNSTCQGMTNSNGLATCQATLGAPGQTTLSASFAGNSSFLASRNSEGFNIFPPATPTPTASPTPTSTSTSTPTSTRHRHPHLHQLQL